MQALKLQFIDPGEPRWTAFLEQQPDANIFHHPAWLDLLQACYGYRPFVIALCDPSGSLHAGLPVMEVSHPMRGRQWIALPFSDHCIPLAATAEALYDLLHLIQASVEKKNFPPTEIRWNLPGAEQVLSPADFVLHTLPLELDFRNVERGIHHSHRRNIRIAQENEIEVRHGTNQFFMDTFYNLHLETRRRQGVPIQPTHYFRLLEETLLRKDLGFISLAFHKTKCLAGAVFLHWNHTLIYKYGASSNDGLPFRPNHLIFWDAIRWGCDHRYSLLDFGRSDIDNGGLRIFKSRWGAQETPLRYLALPRESSKSSLGHIFVPAIQTLIRHTPLWVCKLGGEIYYRVVA